MASRTEGAFTLTDLPLMCIVYPVFRAKCAVSEATEHFRAEDREALGKELIRLEEESSDFLSNSMIEEKNIKEEMRLLDILLGRFRAAKSDDQERLIIATMRKLIEKKNLVTELYKTRLQMTQEAHKTRMDRQAEQTAIQKERALRLAASLKDLLEWEHVQLFMSSNAIAIMEKKRETVMSLAMRYAEMDALKTS